MGNKLYIRITMDIGIHRRGRKVRKGRYFALWVLHAPLCNKNAKLNTDDTDLTDTHGFFICANPYHPRKSVFNRPFGADGFFKYLLHSFSPCSYFNYGIFSFDNWTGQRLHTHVWRLYIGFCIFGSHRLYDVYSHKDWQWNDSPKISFSILFR